MIERDHAPNAGTGLLGANFSRRNRQAPTDDRAGTGRWIAIDESGYDGDQLHGGDRYMILGAVAIDDAGAAAIVDTLRREAGIQKSAAEVKFQKMFTGGELTSAASSWANCWRPAAPCTTAPRCT